MFFLLSGKWWLERKGASHDKEHDVASFGGKNQNQVLAQPSLGKLCVSSRYGNKKCVDSE